MDDPVSRVRSALAVAGIEGDVLTFEDSTRTAAEAAAAAGCELGQIVKTLVIFVGPRPVLVLVPGDRRLSERLLAGRFGIGKKQIRLANGDEVLALTGYTAGGVTPFGLPAPIKVLIDAALARYEVVWTAAGTPNAIVPILLADLARYTGGETVQITT